VGKPIARVSDGLAIPSMQCECRVSSAVEQRFCNSQSAVSPNLDACRKVPIFRHFRAYRAGCVSPHNGPSRSVWVQTWVQKLARLGGAIRCVRAGASVPTRVPMRPPLTRARKVPSVEFERARVLDLRISSGQPRAPDQAHRGRSSRRHLVPWRPPFVRRRSRHPMAPGARQ
jgi:hypothetical protein